MSEPFFLDTNILVYALTSDVRGENCRRIVDAAVNDDAPARTSVLCLEELWHLELSRLVGGLEGTTVRYATVFDPLLAVTNNVFRRALEVDVGSLDAMDRIHAATCLVHDIGVIVTADTGFEDVTLLRRVDPGDGEAVDLLLGVDEPSGAEGDAGEGPVDSSP